MSSVITPIDPATAARIAYKATHRTFWARRWSSLDKFINCWFFNGLEDETISAHFARAALKNKESGTLMMRFLNFFDPNHGAGAIIDDLAQAQQLVELESQQKVVN